jgi:hypothetical protein
VQERALRKVLLIQAIEETDRRGEALPLANARGHACDAGKNLPSLETQPEAQLSTATEWFLVRRADLCLRSLRSAPRASIRARRCRRRHPSTAACCFAFAARVLLSFLDRGRGINIFALPLVVLIAWNLLDVSRLGRRRTTLKARLCSWRRGPPRITSPGLRYLRASTPAGRRTRIDDCWVIPPASTRRSLPACAASPATGGTSRTAVRRPRAPAAYTCPCSVSR